MAESHSQSQIIFSPTQATENGDAFIFDDSEDDSENVTTQVSPSIDLQLKTILSILEKLEKNHANQLRQHQENHKGDQSDDAKV